MKYNGYVRDGFIDKMREDGVECIYEKRINSYATPRKQKVSKLCEILKQCTDNYLKDNNDVYLADMLECIEKLSSMPMNELMLRKNELKRREGGFDTATFVLRMIFPNSEKLHEEAVSHCKSCRHRSVCVSHLCNTCKDDSNCEYCRLGGKVYDNSILECTDYSERK